MEAEALVGGSAPVRVYAIDVDTAALYFGQEQATAANRWSRSSRDLTDEFIASVGVAAAAGASDVKSTATAEEHVTPVAMGDRG